MLFTENQIYHEAMRLPNASKIFLIEKLLENIGNNIDGNIEALQIKQAKRRGDDIRSGRVQPVPGEDALKKVII
ncbi:MAG: addiction module protein [Desulfococcaceae bacterium]|jgi:hypothetical protein|nr:addiction module protein [Desulfococcaceae bacterium]